MPGDGAATPGFTSARLKPAEDFSGTPMVIDVPRRLAPIQSEARG
ncbi:hypothetical protein L665_00098 [Ralstonia solanacearum SD54]|nr:hypothetical protein L665_00098 [Ralstonia solanacearum SD54]